MVDDRWGFKKNTDIGIHICFCLVVIVVVAHSPCTFLQHSTCNTLSCDISGNKNIIVFSIASLLFSMVLSFCSNDLNGEPFSLIGEDCVQNNSAANPESHSTEFFSKSFGHCDLNGYSPPGFANGKTDAVIEHSGTLTSALTELRSFT